jgi:hypothetical protein
MEPHVPNITHPSLRFSRWRLAVQACLLVAGYAAIFSHFYSADADFGTNRTVGLLIFGFMLIASMPVCVLEGFRRFEFLPSGLRIKGVFTDRLLSWDRIELVERGGPVWTLVFVRGKPRPVGIFRYLFAPADLIQLDALLSDRIPEERRAVSSFVDSLSWPVRAARTLRTKHLDR